MMLLITVTNYYLLPLVVRCGLSSVRSRLIVRLTSRKNVVSRNNLSRMVIRLWPLILFISRVFRLGRVNRPLIITMLATTEVNVSFIIEMSRGVVNCNFMCSSVRAWATL